MDGELPKRKSTRLHHYEYSKNGAYFVTLCVKDRHCILWDNALGVTCCPRLSAIGIIVENTILSIPSIYNGVIIEQYAVMPNHVHILISLQNHSSERAMYCEHVRDVPTISTIINQMKGYSTKQIGYTIWQKLFHDHIIRSNNELEEIRKYIEDNPKNWKDDCFYIEPTP